MKLQPMKCPLCGDTLLPTRHNNGVYAHEYQTACAFVCEDLSEIQIEVLRDAALGRAVRKEMERLRNIRDDDNSLSGLSDTEDDFLGELESLNQAALQAAGLMEGEK